ncbi:MAG: ATP-binding protein [Candidatus Omnitrophota bacterium]|jgi:two-component system phosphate regulon sensor histidine kinase PhoR
MRIKLHWKLTIIFCMLGAVLLAASYMYLNPQLKAFIEKDIEDNLRKELFLSKELLEPGPGGKLDLKDADALAGRVSSLLGLRVTIIAPDGKVLGDSDIETKDLAGTENHLDRPEVRQALKEGFGHSRRYSYTLKKYMMYSAIVLGGEPPAAILRLVMPVSSIAEFEAKMQKILIAALAAVFLFSLVLSVIVSSAVTRPIARISSTANSIAAGDLSAKALVSSDDEIGDLAKTLNYMAGEIRSKMDRIASGEAKLEAVLSSMVEGVIVTDEKGSVVVANPSARRMFFIDASPEGKMTLEVIRNSSVHQIVDSILGRRQKIAVKEIQLNKPDERSVMVSAAAVMKEGELSGALLVFHDITELRRLEKVRQDFVANVSHELRTPLSSIKGYSETLMDGGVRDPKEQKEFLEIIYRESDRLAKLIDDILDLSRTESGKMAMVFMPLDVSPVVKRVCAILEKQAAMKSIRIALDIPAGTPRILADESRLSQVILNLLDNAVKYTPEGGDVRISAAPEGNFVRIDVFDTGVGIPEADIPRIFERFYRVDKARSRELGGTGLGLSIVKHIVQAHGGQVSVKSAPEKGSTFSFTIPAV